MAAPHVSNGFVYQREDMAHHIEIMCVGVELGLA